MDLAGTDWKQVSPQSEGFSTQRLEVLRLSEDASDRRDDGPVVRCVGFEYGETKLVSKSASVPGACSAFFAVEIQKGVKFDLDKTVEQLGLEAIIRATVGKKVAAIPAPGASFLFQLRVTVQPKKRHC